MAYSILDDLKKQIPEQTIIELTDDEGTGAIEETRVTEAIAKGDGIADIFYGQVTPVPIPAPIPGIVKQNSIIMGIYWLYMRRSAVPEIWRENYKDVMALLKDISTGKAALPPVTAGEVASGQESAITSGDRIFTRDKMKGF